MPPTLPNLLLKSAVILSLFIPHAAMADPVTESIENALKFGQKDAKYGQVKFNLRYRYEHDDTKRPTKKVGNASTVRLRLGYLSPEFHGFQAYAEYEMNQDIGVNTYNSLRNGHGGFEVIADPQEHELNQLWVSYKGIPDTEIKIGRQRIKLDNDRFIGNVGWRQMEQTFDSVLITNKSLPNTTVKAGYISQAQT
ncbi:MAG: alginate export family protein, partial [Methylococcales bacterium]|nr:alginate export family protein [Methylococcales bacterium]